MEMARVAKGRGRRLLVIVGLLLAGCAGGLPGSQRDLDLRLIRAAEAGRIEEMKRLIRAGADIDASDAEGWTPYLAASSMGRFEAMKILKSLGARTTVYEGPLAAQ